MKHSPLLIAVALLALAPLGPQAQTVELIQMPLADLQAKADSGDAPAMIQLGLRYNLGIGIGQSLKKTQEIMQKAAQAGSHTAAGICALNAWGRAKDGKLAFDSLDKASATGDLTAIRNLGRCYQDGIGCKVDKAKAFELFQKAAVGGDPAALYFLALAYRNGTGTEEDAAKSTELLEQAATSSSFLKAELAECYQKGIGCLKDDARAVELLTESAEAGYGVALRLLGARYWNGNGVSKDLVKAHELYVKAGDAGDGLALAWLASDYFNGNGVEKSFAKYEELMLKAAENDYPAALNSLGADYQNGTGVTKDLAKANELYQKAGDLGNGMGYRNLGVNYEIGKGVTKDLAKANELYQMAGDLGDGMGYRFLGTNYADGIGATKNPDKAEEFYLKAGASGDGVGYYYLAHAYREGTWRTKDEAKAFGYYQKGAGLNNSDSVLMVGWCYENGSGVPKDAAQAASFYQKAAAMGNFAAMSNLGSFLRDGVGIPKDLPKAVEWFQKSSDGGNSYGQYNLGKLYSSGRGVKKDMAKAVELFTKSSAQDYPAATFDLGSCYENGLGVKKDKTKARELYEKAAKLGNADAQQRLKDLGPAPTSSAATASPAGPKGYVYVPGVYVQGKKSTPEASEEVTQLLTQARRELDLEQFESCIGNAKAAIAAMDAAKESDWLAWTLAHATLSAAITQWAIESEAGNVKGASRSYRNAIATAEEGMLQDSESQTKLKTTLPDRFARLLQERGYAKARLSGTIRKESDYFDQREDVWLSAMKDFDDALACAKSPVFVGSIHTTIAMAWARRQAREQSLKHAEKAKHHAEHAVRLTMDQTGGELHHARALFALGGVIGTESHIRGRGNASDPGILQAEVLIRKASATFDKLIPGTSVALGAQEFLAICAKERRAESIDNFLGLMDFLSSGRPGTTDRERQLRGMANENYNAREAGRPEPYPGVR